MPRPKGSKNKPKNGADDAAGTGHNSTQSLSDEQRQTVFFRHRAKWADEQAKIDAAKERQKEIGAIANAELGPNTVKDIKDSLKMDDAEGEDRFVDETERRLKLSRWMGIVISDYSQLDMFRGEKDTPIKRAFESGKVARFAGKECKPPHDPGVPQHDAWIEGWHKGQQLLNEADRRDDAVVFERDGTQTTAPQT